MLRAARDELGSTPSATVTAWLVEHGHLTANQLDELAAAPSPATWVVASTVADRSTTPSGFANDSALPAALDRYEVLGRLGAGGMGEVLAVADPKLRRVVAAKVMHGEHDDGRRAKFVLEACITGQLEHPGIPPIHDLGATADGRDYFTMKRIEGRDLAALLDLERAAGVALGQGTRPLAAWLALLVKVCDTLAFAHSKGVIHRDLKPANIRVGEFGEVVVMDWGLAKVIDTSAESPAVVPDVLFSSENSAPEATQEGAIMGTPAYMPPEQASGEISKLDERADVYALGAILYEILALHPPFEGRTVHEILYQVLEVPLVSPSQRAPAREIPRALEAIALRALAYEPCDRYATVGALRADLEAFLDGRAVDAAPDSLAAAARRWARRHRFLLRGVAAVAATVLAFGAYFAQNAVRERAARRRSLAVARAQLDEVRPALVLTAAASQLPPPHAASASRLPPSPSQLQAYTSHLGSLRALAARYDAVLALDPDDPAARLGQHDTWITLGRLATAAEEWMLAEHAFTQAERARVDPELASRLREDVGRDRAARQLHHAERVDELIGRVRRGEVLTAEGYDSVLVEIASYRERPIVERMMRELDGIVGRLESAACDALYTAARPTDAEAASGEREIEDLASAVEAWRAYVSMADDAQPPTTEQDQRVTLALERLVRRQAAVRAVAQTATLRWQDVLGLAQELELDRPGERGTAVARLACDVLGLLGETAGPVALLGRYLGAEWEESRAVHAGLALVRLSATSTEARVRLETIVGLGRRGWYGGRWKLTDAFWRQVTSLGQELRLAELGAEEGSGEGSPESADDFLRRGLIRRSKGDVDGAIADFDRAIAIDPRFVPAYNNRGDARENRGDVDGAIADFDRAIAINPRSASSYAYRGTARLARGDQDGAMADLDLAVALEPRAAAFRGRRGLAHEARGDLTSAVRDFDRALELDPRDAKLFSARGAVRQALGDHAGALDDFERALALDPRSVSSYHRRGSARQARGDLDGALADYDRALVLDPRRAATYYNRGTVRMARGDLRRATSDFESAIELEPHNAAAHDQLGLARHASGDLDGALVAFERAIELDPRSAVAYNNRSLTRRAKGDLDGAMADIEAAVALDPRNAMAHCNRGSYRKARGDLEGALADLDRAVDLDPRSAAILVIRGTFRHAKGDLDGALADLDRAIAVDPRSQAAFAYRGVVHKLRGELALAIEDYGRAIELDPRRATTYHRRGIARIDHGDLAGGVADLEQAVRLDPRAWQSYLNLGVTLGRLGRRPEALAALTQARALAPATEHEKIDAAISKHGGK